MSRNNLPDFLPNVLMSHVQNQPQAIAYTFLCHENNQEESISYAELDRRARLLAEILYQKNLTEERIILLYPQAWILWWHF